MPHPVRAIGGGVSSGGGPSAPGVPQTPGESGWLGRFSPSRCQWEPSFSPLGQFAWRAGFTPWPDFAGSVWCNQILAAKGLRQESGLVYDAPGSGGDLEGPAKRCQ